jgi:glycosyltransferase involved in cell wall biosynthesis
MSRSKRRLGTTATSSRAEGASPAEGTQIAFILKGYPRLSETFIAQEIKALEGTGLRLAIMALRRPTDRLIHPIHAEIRAPVTYLPEYLHDAPILVLRAWWRARRLPGYRAAMGAWLKDLRRDPTRNRIRRFGQALVLASHLPRSIERLHAHFLHTPASVARYAALLTGLPWSASAHAKDIWTTPDWDLGEKLASLDWAVTCTQAGFARLQQLTADPARLTLLYHGLDGARFPPMTAVRPPRRGDRPDDPVILLSVGRLVEKKGYGDLLAALALLPAELSWHFVHIGSGPEKDRLMMAAGHLGIAERIEWLGAQAHDAVLTRYRAADLFVLPSIIAGDGDRDGLPNVLLEAQSQGLPCISTGVSAIPELILPEMTGLLVPPGDPPALALALARLISTPDERRRLGSAGEQRVRELFSFDGGIDRLARRFRTPPA